MDAFLPALVAALLAEIGDKTQLLALALALHFRKPLPVLAGIALAALANAALAALGGVLIAPLLTHEAATLMLALALLFAGGGALLKQRPPVVEGARFGVFLASLVGFFLLEFGDKTQFLTFAITLRSSAFWLSMVGATIGVVAANLIAIVLAGDRGDLRLTGIRRIIGGLFIALGLWATVAAFRLI